MKYFQKFCPLSQFLYFCSVLLFMMFLQNPIILAVAVFSALLICFFICKNIRFAEIEFLIIMITVCTLLNPLFSRGGIHVLFFLNGRAITVEALLYGANFGLLLCAVFLWFKVFSFMFGTERFLSLFGSKLPKTALITSVCMHFVPLFVSRYRSIRSSAEMLGQNKERNIIKIIKNHLQSFSALISWAFEASLQCSDSMTARGYGKRKRTHYKPFKYHLRDSVLIVFVLIFTVILLISTATGKLYFQFYPEFKIAVLSIASLVAYISYFILCTVPLICQVKGGFYFAKRMPKN